MHPDTTLGLVVGGIWLAALAVGAVVTLVRRSW